VRGSNCASEVFFQNDIQYVTYLRVIERLKQKLSHDVTDTAIFLRDTKEVRVASLNHA
jgi:hypothetical protein